MANIGDSGFILMRKRIGNYEKKYRSSDQQHVFNQPYQLGTGGDQPEDAE